jgi:hypothetical protein
MPPFSRPVPQLSCIFIPDCSSRQNRYRIRVFHAMHLGASRCCRCGLLRSPSICPAVSIIVIIHASAYFPGRIPAVRAKCQVQRVPPAIIARPPHRHGNESSRPRTQRQAIVRCARRATAGYVLARRGYRGIRFGDLREFQLASSTPPRVERVRMRANRATRQRCKAQQLQATGSASAGQLGLRRIVCYAH